MRSAKAARPPRGGPRAGGSPALVIVLAAVALGLTTRIVSLVNAPRYSYAPDHLMVMSWSDAAFEHGPTALYFMPTPQQQPAFYHQRVFQRGQWVRLPDIRPGGNARPALMPMPYNYPPASTAIFWAQGALWHLLSAPVTTEIPAGVRRQLPLPAKFTTRVVNTGTSRFIAALPGMLFDFWLAWGVAVLVRTLRGPPRRPALEALAFAVTLLAPPVFLDSAFWNQADAWITAPLVWCLVWLLQRRWWLAGLVYGVALMIKPQAILFGPVLVFVLASLLLHGGDRRLPDLLGFAKFAVTAVVVAFAIALPFMLASPPPAWAEYLGDDPGWRRWFDRSYGDLVFGGKYARTTLNAFNVWWFDYAPGVGAAIERGERPDFNALRDAHAPAVAGLSKAALGKLLLVGGIVLVWAGCWRRWRGSDLGWLGCAGLVLLAAFVLPTSVHERYIYYCIPFLIALAFLRPLFILPLGLLLVVGTAEMTSFRWVRLGDAGSRGTSLLLAAMTVAAFLISLVLLVRREPQARPQGRRPA